MGPLQGVVVVDLSQVISGPMAGAWLAAQGAEVVKIEDPAGDPSRLIGPRKQGASALYLAVNRNKRVKTADLKDPAQAQAVLELIDRADALIQNWRPGVAERLGFGYETLAARNPRLVYCSISGFGADGPRAGERAYDSIIQAVAGVAACQDDLHGEPDLVRSYMCDKTVALMAAQAVCAGLVARARDGRGQKIDINMFDAACAFIWPDGMWNHAFLDEAPETQPEVSGSYRLWRTKDGHVSLAALQQKEFEALLRAVDAPELASDPRFATAAGRMTHRVEWRAVMEAKVAAFTTDELETRLRGADAPGGKVNSRDGLLSEPQALANETFAIMDGESLGRLRAARHPARFSQTPAPAPRPPRRA